MPLLSVGDLASSFQIRRLSTGLKVDLTRLGKELSTGLRSDLGTTLSGDFGPYAAIERSLTALTAYQTANTEAAGLLGAAQLALGSVQGMSRDLAPGLLTAANTRDVAMVKAIGEDARQKFDGVVQKLNIRSADRVVFAGAATDRPALAGADALLAGLRAAVAGQTTAAGVAAAAEAWFDAPGGGFETAGYLGSLRDMGPLQVAEGEHVAVDFRADDPVLRDTLRGIGLAALIAEGVLAGDVAEQAALIGLAADRLMTADGDMTDLRARIGAMEARVEDAQARNAAERSAYELARGELVGVDPYTAATELQAVYAQIETLYTVTARIAGLNFREFMR